MWFLVGVEQCHFLVCEFYSCQVNGSGVELVVLAVVWLVIAGFVTALLFV
jgi:hypothetical protein